MYFNTKYIILYPISFCVKSPNQIWLPRILQTKQSRHVTMVGHISLGAMLYYAMLMFNGRTSSMGLHAVFREQAIEGCHKKKKSGLKNQERRQNLKVKKVFENKTKSENNFKCA